MHLFQNEKVVLEASIFLKSENMYGIVVQTYISSLGIIYSVRTQNVRVRIRR